MKKIQLIILGITATLFITSCGTDNQAPEITISVPTAQEVVETGGDIHLEFDITDDVDLNQFKIDIHGDHDGHSHGKLTEILPAFDTIIIENISGTMINRHLHIEIPADAWPGPYHVGIYATDKSGNESMKSVDIIVINPMDEMPPSVDITAPANGASVVGSVQVIAQLSDMKSDMVTAGEIRSIEVILTNGTEEFDLGDYDETENFNGKYDPLTGTFQSTFALPNGISSGNWQLEIHCYDSYFNEAHQSVNIIIP
jgi:hypothetical protein